MDCTYIFFDEHYEHDDIFYNLIVSAILVSQSQYEVLLEVEEGSKRLTQSGFMTGK